MLPQLVMEVGRIDLPRAIEVGAWIGLVMAVATFLASPVLGNLSDHFGRRASCCSRSATPCGRLCAAHDHRDLAVAVRGAGIVGHFRRQLCRCAGAIADITAPEGAPAISALLAQHSVVSVSLPAPRSAVSWARSAPFVAAAITCRGEYALWLFHLSRKRYPANGAGRSTGGVPTRSARGERCARCPEWTASPVLVLWQIASLVYPMTWSFYCIAQLGWSPGMIGASLAAVGVMIALGQVAVVGPAVALRRRDAATLGILVAVAVYIGYAFTTSTIGAFLLSHRVAGARAAVADGDDVAACHRRYAGRVQGISAMAMGLGQLAAPMLLTGAMAYFTADAAPVRFPPGAAFVVAAIFGLLAILMLRRLPRVTQTADQMPPSVTA